MGIRTGKPRGRPKGSPNKASVARQKAIAASGMTPLEYLMSVMRDTNAAREARLEAAKAAAPYVHPRLSTIAISAKMTLSHEERLAMLE